MPHTVSGPIDWAKLRQQLPAGRTPEEKARRQQMFDAFDPNRNGYLSLAEVDRGLGTVLDAPGRHILPKPVILRAFQASKAAAKAKRGGRRSGDDYVERSEFRLLLAYLRTYLELYAMFDRVDTGDDGRVSLAEFTAAAPQLRKWGVEVADPVAAFREVDRDGGGQILFNEFAQWAIAKHLDLEDDDD
eukprot:TRINITY_DN14417_c0_g1_i1.p2 TRINITY_DN14417_c0_g1~~TRINITY_DN14417_c0_g1_i1.p2  ORF type:complete len:188 (+),score=47.26 TRINITY_DN14417_c0_g1_i1:66-629(+)